MNDREKKTVSKMIRIYCCLKHKQKYKLCPDCCELEEYAHSRLECCPFGENKPVCEKCTVHCYKMEYSQKMKEVMRFVGPRMLFYHPYDAFLHFFGRKKIIK